MKKSKSTEQKVVKDQVQNFWLNINYQLSTINYFHTLLCIDNWDSGVLKTYSQLPWSFAIHDNITQPVKPATEGNTHNTE